MTKNKSGNVIPINILCFYFIESKRKINNQKEQTHREITTKYNSHKIVVSQSQLNHETKRMRERFIFLLIFSNKVLQLIINYLLIINLIK